MLFIHKLKFYMSENFCGLRGVQDLIIWKIINFWEVMSLCFTSSSTVTSCCWSCSSNTTPHAALFLTALQSNYSFPSSNNDRILWSLLSAHGPKGCKTSTSFIGMSESQLYNLQLGQIKWLTRSNTQSLYEVTDPLCCAKSDTLRQYLFREKP